MLPVLLLMLLCAAACEVRPVIGHRSSAVGGPLPCLSAYLPSRRHPQPGRETALNPFSTASCESLYTLSNLPPVLNVIYLSISRRKARGGSSI